MHPLSLFRYCPKCGSALFVENNAKSKKCRSCGFVYYFNPVGATVAVILNDKKELLVATRAKNPAKGTYDLPGGFIDMYETAEEGVIREVKEETGLETDEVQYLFSLPNIYEYSGFKEHTIDMFFLCKVNNTDEMSAADDVSGLQFVKVSDLHPGQFGLKSIREGIRMMLASGLLEK